MTYDRQQFNIRNQTKVESSDAYVTDLRILSKSCEFENLTDSLLRDRLFCGVKKDTVRSKLLRETDLTLQKAIVICRAANKSQQLTAVQSLSAEGNVGIVKKKCLRTNQAKVLKTNK